MCCLWLSWKTIWSFPETGDLLQLWLMIWIHRNWWIEVPAFVLHLSRHPWSLPSDVAGPSIRWEVYFAFWFWLSHVICFGQWDASRRDPNRGLKCPRKVGLCHLCVRHQHEKDAFCSLLVQGGRRDVQQTRPHLQQLDSKARAGQQAQTQEKASRIILRQWVLWK